MTTLLWLLGFLGTSWVNYWILAMGGAKKIEGWLSFFVVGWFALDWHAEQIRLYVLIIWLALEWAWLPRAHHRIAHVGAGARADRAHLERARRLAGSGPQEPAP